MNESPASAPDHSWSLRNRLITLVGLAIAAAWLTGGFAVYLAVSEESAKLFDQRLVEIAELLMSYADLEIDTARREEVFVSHVEDTPGDARYLHQVWSEKHELLLRSSDAPPTEPMAPLDRLGFDTRIVNGEQMRTTVQLSSGWRRIHRRRRTAAIQTIIRRYVPHQVPAYAFGIAASVACRDLVGAAPRRCGRSVTRPIRWLTARPAIWSRSKSVRPRMNSGRCSSRRMTCWPASPRHSTPNIA